jgi:hypothetical protein
MLIGCRNIRRSKYLSKNNLTINKNISPKSNGSVGMERPISPFTNPTSLISMAIGVKNAMIK